MFEHFINIMSVGVIQVCPVGVIAPTFEMIYIPLCDYTTIYPSVNGHGVSFRFGATDKAALILFISVGRNQSLCLIAFMHRDGADELWSMYV